MNLQTFELKLTCRFLLKRQYFPVPCHKHRLFMWFHGFGDTFLHLMPGLNVFCGLNSSQLNLTCSVALDSAGLNSFQWGDQRELRLLQVFWTTPFFVSPAVLSVFLRVSVLHFTLMFSSLHPSPLTSPHLLIKLLSPGGWSTFQRRQFA